MVKIENGTLQLEIAERGAEMMSLRLCGKEYLWQGDPAIWEDRAPIMFPICGRLNEQRYFHNGREYNMGLHGLLWKCDLTLTEKTDTSAVLTLTDNEETRAAYPFNFEDYFFILACSAAMSAARSFTRFSMPSPRSKRTKRTTSHLPFSILMTLMSGSLTNGCSRRQTSL